MSTELIELKTIHEQFIKDLSAFEFVMKTITPATLRTTLVEKTKQLYEQELAGIVEREASA